MKKALPKAKKSIKSFILDEDAKVIDKTATKIALTASFLALNFAINTDDANAKGHANHTNHSNHVYHQGPEEYPDPGDRRLGNEQNNEVSVTYTVQGYSMTVDVPAKSAASAHGNHYNHVDGSGKS